MPQKARGKPDGGISIGKGSERRSSSEISSPVQHNNLIREKKRQFLEEKGFEFFSARWERGDFFRLSEERGGGEVSDFLLKVFSSSLIPLCHLSLALFHLFVDVPRSGKKEVPT